MRVLIIFSCVFAVAFASNAYITGSAPAVVAYTQLEPKSSYEYSSAVNTHDYQNYQHVKSNIEEPVLKVAAVATAPVATIAVEHAPPTTQIVHSYEVPTIVKTFSEPIALPAVSLTKGQSIATIRHAPTFVHHQEPTAAVVAVKHFEPTYVQHEPSVVAVKHVDPTYVHHHEPAVVAVKHFEPTYVHHEQAVIANHHESSVVAVKHFEPTYVHHHEAAPSVVAVKHFEPTYAHHEPSVVAVKHFEPTYVHHEPSVVAVKHFEPTYVHHHEAAVIANHHEPAVVAVKHFEPTYVHHHEAAPAVFAVKSAPVITPIVESVIESKVIGEAVVGQGILATKSQYHAQNVLGEASYGHAEPTQTHNAIQDAAGNKAGSFSYVSPDGRVLTTDYVADENGYRAASNALPTHHVHKRSLPSILPLPLLREQTHTSIVHNPGHASSYRVDTVDHVPAVRTIHTTVPIVKTIVPAPVWTHSVVPRFYNTPYLSVGPYYSKSIVPQTYTSYVETVPAAVNKETYHSTTIVH